jgi:hypothetical protein
VRLNYYLFTPYSHELYKGTEEDDAFFVQSGPIGLSKSYGYPVDVDKQQQHLLYIYHYERD